MRQQKISQLYDERMAVAFYQERYARGYMDEWPIEKKRRIFEVIRSFKLPDAGEALDFGCGNGVFTDVIKQALPPRWRVYGADISEIAVENAKRRFPGCIFSVTGRGELAKKRFDFLFSHHVLEHVHNLPQVLREMNGRMKDESAMLHILPCGNAGSFEHDICLLRAEGIDPQLGNRFFFEDEGHVRRSTTEQMSELCKANGFILAKEYYCNHYYGAIDWITQSGPAFVRFLTDTSSAIDEEAKGKLAKIRCKFLFLWGLRYPAAFVEGWLRKKGKTVRDFIFLAPGLLLYFPAKAVDGYLRGKALDEWNERKAERGGSEMFLFFKRK